MSNNEIILFPKVRYRCNKCARKCELNVDITDGHLPYRCPFMDVIVEWEEVKE